MSGFAYHPDVIVHVFVLDSRIDEDQPMSHETLYRWLDRVIEEEHGVQQVDLAYLIFLVDILPNSIRPLACVIKHTDPQSLFLSLNGQDLVVPGDYALYLSGMTYSQTPSADH